MTFADIGISPDAAYGPLLYVSLYFTTFVHEGTAIATGAIFVLQQQSTPTLTAACLVAGIVSGDLGIYGLGALARRSAWLQRRLGVAGRVKSQHWFSHHVIPTVAMCRVVPGVLFPTFLSYGWCGVPFRKFAATTLIVTGLYVPLLLTLFVQFGKQIAPLIQHGPWLVAGALVMAATVFVSRYLWTRYRDREPAGLPVAELCPQPAA